MSILFLKIIAKAKQAFRNFAERLLNLLNTIWSYPDDNQKDCDFLCSVPACNGKHENYPHYP